jgi:hypothetical protein
LTTHVALHQVHSIYSSIYTCHIQQIKSQIAWIVRGIFWVCVWTKFIV